MSQAQAFLMFTLQDMDGACWSLEVRWLWAVLPVPEDGHMEEPWSAVPIPMQRPRAEHTPCGEAQSR